MVTSSLSRRDFNVLEKIRDPESNPSAAVMIDPNLPKDPVITDPSTYARVAQKEREIVLAMQEIESQLAKTKPETPNPAKEYRECISTLGQLISEYPRYASARNNRAQALRRLYGDMMALPQRSDPRALVQGASDLERSEAAMMALADLDEAIRLLTPRSLFASISPQASKTLSMSHTQRAAIYHMTVKSLQPDEHASVGDRKESNWTRIEFEEAASRDFASGGRYGNDVAKGLAVGTNPTAKLCGQIVREAMKKEYGPAFEV
ncbi:hypothetical protein SLS62_002204 [Diatrype stigma]|uniref:Tetratricopeptide repeat protein 36 n=1 Tax=Diatrype stigma TaxID=117547 RepID=A0AAN9UZC8_9PEZI